MKDKLTNNIINLVARYGRYGTPRITAMLNCEGFKVNHKRVERIWRICRISHPQHLTISLAATALNLKKMVKMLEDETIEFNTLRNILNLIRILEVIFKYHL